MQRGLDLSMHVMLDFVERINLRAYRCSDEGRVGAMLCADGTYITVSGPVAQVTAVLRELADKVDATECDRERR